ncbi:MAG: hypothetical protein ABJL72_10890 [Roseobacter sp.]
MADAFSFDDKARKVMRSELPHMYADLAMGLTNYTRFFEGDPTELLDVLVSMDELPPRLANDGRFATMYATYEHLREDIGRIAHRVSLPREQVIKILKDRCELPFDQAGSGSP